MAIPKKKRRTITVRNLKFSWAVSLNWAECEDGTHLYIRPKTGALAPLNISLIHTNKAKDYFPLFKQKEDPGKQRTEIDRLVFTPKVIEIIITWALDNGWASKNANLVYILFNNGFQWR